ncbi:cysteine-rich receptor-like protein kinase 10 [Prunus yedoensis var. nudiflora]|uniref:Cysteine-rich receptor-like protein kinase 10 n=1 Tax=Prunus yedoensis var. nudiflora TaxID=2094558 RepID=A0A314YZH5_PRUYE|nr:cysteine-rich receptor-like protein kinase 10 [Prunus yedoensis var. nudiflora]
MEPLMASSRFVFFLSPILLLISSQSLAQPEFPSHSCFYEKGNYTTGSTYQTNLNTLLSSLSSPSNNGNGYGFYNSSFGENADQVHAIALCRGDVMADTCRGCLSNSTKKLTQVCPNQKEAIGFYDECMLRYANRSIYGAMEKDPVFPLWWNIQNLSSSDVDGFFHEMRKLLKDLNGQAAANGSLRKFAVGNTTAPNFQPIYGLAQCTPDLAEQACSDCLDAAMGDIPTYCDRKQGCRVQNPSCTVRYEVNRFYDPTTVVPLPSSPQPLSSPLPPSTSTGGSKSNRSRTVIIIVPIVVSVVLIVIFFCICLRVRRTKAKLETRKLLPGGNDTDEIGSAEPLQFDLATIRVSTDDFSEANKLGQGGFGSVYRGRLLNGKDIAVKRLSTNSGQGDLEFKNEVLLVAKLQHRNLVRLLGFCLEGSERLLVYEFVPNASLDHIIFDPTKRAQLDWVRRYKIIVGTARGLLYLHEDSRLRIIHRDLKASNILIDAEMNPKISDFGMARLFVPDQTQGNTSRIVGTYGYMAPEYAFHGHFSVKSDVYSFGVLVLEIVSGQKRVASRTGTMGRIF